MKRFYKLVSIDKVDHGYYIMLDNRSVKTKLGAFLCAPNHDIATRIALEWSAQEEEIIPDTMPFTQILTTQIDRVSIERDIIISTILKYFNTDLLCYVASEPKDLVKLQQEKWQIWLDWFENEFDYEIETTTALAAITHDKRAHESILEYVSNLDDARLTILQIITSVSGSIILALALLKGQANAIQIFEACFVEEQFKEALYDTDKYGADPILEKTQKAAMQDLKSAQDYLSLL